MYGVVEMDKGLIVEDMNRSLYVVQACTLDSMKLLKEVILNAWNTLIPEQALLKMNHLAKASYKSF